MRRRKPAQPRLRGCHVQDQTTDTPASTMAPDDDDDALMRAFAQGDARAFERLYARHHGALYRFVRRVLGREAGTQGDEVFQDTWLRVVHAREHRAHRLARTVIQQAEQIAAKGAALGHVREARFERLEPSAQPIEPRRSVRRQSRQHARTAYRTRRPSTRLNSRSHADSGANPWI